MNRVPLERKVLSENDLIAANLRNRFSEHNILCFNLVSSPGAGKTALLERTLEAFPRDQRVAVLTGIFKPTMTRCVWHALAFPSSRSLREAPVIWTRA